MLKHCSPSSVDLTRRSRRNLADFGSDFLANANASGDTVSLRSCATSSSSSSSSSAAHTSPHSSVVSHASDRITIHVEQPPLPELPETRTATTATSAVTFRDAATSPKCSPLLPVKSLRRHHSHNLAQHALARQKSLGNAFTVEEDPNSHHAQFFSGNSRMPIKVYAKCLRSDIEYKTLSVSPQTTSRELIWMLLSKYRMKHRDPKLFYLTMDINIKRTGIPLKRSLSLEDDSRPVELKSCHPWGECKFTLQMRKGAVVRVYDSVLMAESKYKCLLISEDTTAEEVIRILFHCYGLDRIEQAERYCIVAEPTKDVSAADTNRRLRMDERPVMIQGSWPSPGHAMFVLRLAPLTPDSNSLAGELMMADSISGAEESSSTSSGSDFSALRFRDSPISTSTRFVFCVLVHSLSASSSFRYLFFYYSLNTYKSDP